MVKRYKKLLIIICIFFFTFFTFTEYKEQEVKANVLAGAIGGMMLEGSGAAAAGAIVAAGPYIAAFAVISIGAGIVYKNREEIQAGLVNAYNYAKTQGKNLMDYFSTDVNGNVSVKSEGVNLIKSSVKNYLADPSIVSGLVGEYTVPAYNGSPGILNISFPLTSNDSDLLILNIKGQHLSSTRTPGTTIKLDGKELLFNSNIFDGIYTDGIYIALEYSASGWKFWSSTDSFSSLKNIMSKTVNGQRYGNSICADLTISNKTIGTDSANVSVSRLLGDSLGNTDSVDADVTFRNPALESEKDISVSIPTDLTWDKVIDKTWDKTLEAESEKTIPDEGTGEGTKDDIFNPTIRKQLDFSPLYLSFATKFPFSIPFDLARIIGDFKANKQEPIFYIDMSGFDSTDSTSAGFEIDFTKFTTLFDIVRTFILVSFIVFLAIKTRDIIKA